MAMAISQRWIMPLLRGGRTCLVSGMSPHGGRAEYSAAGTAQYHSLHVASREHWQGVDMASTVIYNRQEYSERLLQWQLAGNIFKRTQGLIPQKYFIQWELRA